MTYSNSDPMLWIFMLAIVVSVVASALLKWLYRKRGGVATGWGGALFIGLCWIATLALIIYRTVH